MNMKLLSKFLRVVIVFTLIQTSLFAVPADKTQTFSKLQINGKTISYTLNGDEFISWLSSVDGYTMLENKKGDIVYAQKDESGRLIKSNILASDSQYRSAEEILFLSSIEKGLFYNSSQLDVFRKSREERYSDNIANFTQTSSTPNFLVILVNFSNISFDSTNAVSMANQISQTNYTTDGATGSVKDYYYDNSMGALDANFVVVGPYTLSQNQAYYGAETEYGGKDIRPREMVEEACSLASQNLNFAIFDNNGDNIIDMVHIVFAGRGQHNGGGADAIWPHSWSIPSSPTFNGVSLNKYSCSNELRTVSQMDGIGTICHEMGHVLGLPDFYDTDYGESGGQSIVLNSWDLMSSGNYNNEAKTPPYLSSLERNMLGWLDPIILNLDSTVCTLPALADSNKAYKVNLTSNEFFLFEHRTKKKWDAYTPGKGMLVFHGDNTLINQWIYSRINQININPTNRGFFILPAYGDSTNVSTTSTTYPGSENITSFIGSKLKNFTPSGKTLINIAYGQDSILNFIYFGNTPTLTVLPITNSNPTSATLNGEVVGMAVTSMGFEYRAIGQTNFIQETSPTNPVQITISNLVPNSNYEYRLFCVSPLGTLYSNTETFITDCGISLNPPFTEGFESLSTCWNIISSQGDNFEIVPSGGLPVCSPHGGTNMLKYNSYNVTSNEWTALISPKVIFPSYFYDISFWIYRSNGMHTKSDEVVEVYINSSKSFKGARKIGSISNDRLTSPTMSANGWYNYICNIGVESVGQSYIILKAISKRGYNIYIDDFSVVSSQYLAPILKTDSITNKTHNSATIHSSFYQGTETIISKGIEYKPSFATNWDSVTVQGNTTPYSITLSSLIQNQNYYLRPYALTPTGKKYSQTIDTFMTLPLSMPVVITDTSIFINPSSVRVYGSYDQGSYPILTSGFKYKPTTSNTWTTITQASNQPIYNNIINNLLANTTYQYRAFITNYIGTTYAEFKTFTTQQIPITLGEVITMPPFHNSDSILLRGYLINTGYATSNIELGFVYSQNPNPEISQVTTTKITYPYTPTVTDFETMIINPCLNNDTYYYRAYITNQVGTYYGEDISVSCSGLNTEDIRPITINLYPNPTSSSSKLEIDNIDGKVEINITDIRGRVIRSISVSANNKLETTIDLRNQSKGIYFISIITDKTKTTEKLILR